LKIITTAYLIELSQVIFRQIIETKQRYCAKNVLSQRPNLTKIIMLLTKK